MVPRFNPTGQGIMSKRINVILPDSTVAVLDRVTTKGNRSQFISRAVLHFVAAKGKANLRERLKAEALANAGRDVALAAAWFPLEEEAARAIGPSGTSKKVTAPKQR
jgi:hypothetical protein